MDHTISVRIFESIRQRMPQADNFAVDAPPHILDARRRQHAGLIREVSAWLRRQPPYGAGCTLDECYSLMREQSNRWGYGWSDAAVRAVTTDLKPKPIEDEESEDQ